MQETDRRMQSMQRLWIRSWGGGGLVTLYCPQRRHAATLYLQLFKPLHVPPFYILNLVL